MRLTETRRYYTYVCYYTISKCYVILIRSSPFVQYFENEPALVPHRTLIRFAIEH